MRGPISLPWLSANSLNVGRRISSLLHKIRLFQIFQTDWNGLHGYMRRTTHLTTQISLLSFQLRVRVAHSTTQMFKPIMNWGATIQGYRIITCQSATTHLVRKIWQESELITNYLWTFPLCPVWTIGFDKRYIEGLIGGRRRYSCSYRRGYYSVLLSGRKYA